MVPHCKFYKGKGYDANRSLKNSPAHYIYFTNNLILIDLKRFRENGFADNIRQFYQSAYDEKGYDPFFLSQDL